MVRGGEGSVFGLICVYVDDCTSLYCGGGLLASLGGREEDDRITWIARSRLALITQNTRMFFTQVEVFFSYLCMHRKP